jgi:hypothetical protein
MKLDYFLRLFLRLINLKNDPLDSSVTLINILKRKLFPNKSKILIACMPKSGSTFLSKLLAHYTGYKYTSIVYDLKQNEQDIYLPKLIDNYNHHLIIHQHCRATISNVLLLKEHQIKVVVLVRKHI